MWVLDRGGERRIGRIALTTPGSHIHVGKSDPPLLSVTGIDQKLYVFDALTTKLLHEIEGLGSSPGFIQGFH